MTRTQLVGVITLFVSLSGSQFSLHAAEQKTPAFAQQESTQAQSITQQKNKQFALNEDGFNIWKQSLAADFELAGISPTNSADIINSLHFIARVIKLDRRQPESTLTHEQYLQRVIPEWKVKKAREAYQQNYAALKQVEQETGVQARFIVALWGKESNFGSITGNYHVPSALATLAFEGRRASFFKKELINAAKIIDAGHIKNDEMKGSWAGAMGHCQFMPSSFLRFAKDGDNDGKTDIWNNKADVFASMANYLKQSGWDGERTWGRQIKLTKPFNQYNFGKKYKQSLASWQAQGVRKYSLADLPKVDTQAYLIAPGGEKGRLYLVYNNYDVLLKWNRSSYFGTGVGYLADRIAYPAIKVDMRGE